MDKTCSSCGRSHDATHTRTILGLCEQCTAAALDPASIQLRVCGGDLRYGSLGAAGLDLISPVRAALHAQQLVDIDTGVAVEIPEGHLGLIVSRSGCVRRGLLVEGEGVIDSDYRGTIRVLLRATRAVEIHEGDRVAQLLILRSPRCRIQRVESLTPTARGAGGFGSTGR